MKRYIFILSDGTGITAEHLSNSLLSQFREVDFEKEAIPYIDNINTAQKVVEKINDIFESTKTAPLVFMTIIDLEIVSLIKSTPAVVFDLFNTFIEPLEQVLKTKSSYTVGQTHGLVNSQSYTHRINAVEFALAHDDGVRTNSYKNADLILLGVSRSGKTPSCLYLALNFGIKAANFPFTEDLLDWHKLPEVLIPYKNKLFGLTIKPERLKHIRSERSPGSRYATLEQCRREINELEELYKKERIPYLDSTKFSIEEITTHILAQSGLKRLV